MEILLAPKKITQIFVLIVICLTLAHIVGLFIVFYLGHNYAFGFVPMFDLNGEKNIPTLYASLALIFCSLLLTIIAVVKKKDGASYWPQWAGLAAIFLFLSLDEILVLHERLGGLVRSEFAPTKLGLAYLIAWTIPYSLLLIIFWMAYVKFLIHLPARTRLMFIIAGSIYVLGTLGFEVIGGIHHYLFGYTQDKTHSNVVYAVLLMFEEVLEMVGIVFFIYALTSYMASELEGISLRMVSQVDTLPSRKYLRS